MELDYYRFKIGKHKCVSLYDGYHNYKLEQMVSNVPRQQVELALQARGLSRQFVTTPYTFLYVDTGEHHVLVDVGAGDLFPTTGRLLQSMHDAEIATDIIDHIFITHAHPDHVGGILDEKGVPIFDQATYFICKKEWDFWFSEQAMYQTGAWMTEFARENLAPIQANTVLVEGEEEILPGVRVLFAPGHTPGHMVVSFASQGEQLLYIGDTAVHPIHLEYLDWTLPYDILTDKAADSKRQIFDLAAATECWVIGQHFPPFPSLGHIVKRDIGWVWQPVVNV